MSAKKELKHLFWFWAALLGPVVIGFMLAIVILSANNLGVDLTKEGLALFLDYFKIPLSIAGLSIPATALVIANHRSQQTLAAIDASESQNTFSNFIKHREEFIKMLKELESELGIVFSEKHLLYKELFPHNSPVSFDIAPMMAWLYHVRSNYSQLLNRVKTGLAEHQVERVYIDTFKLSAYMKFRVKEGFILDSSETFNGISPDRDWRVSYTKQRPVMHLELIHNVIMSICFFCHYEDDIDLLWPQSPFIDFDVHAKNIFSRYKPIGTAL